MALSPAMKQAMVDGGKNYVGGATGWVSVHTGAGGGTTGANEATGGGYVRKQCSLTSGSGGNVTGSTVNVPVAAGTYTEGGLWSASSAGNFGGSAAFTGGSVVVAGTGASIDITPSLAVV